MCIGNVLQVTWHTRYKSSIVNHSRVVIVFMFLSGAVANQDYGESKEATLYFRCIEMRLCKGFIYIILLCKNCAGKWQELCITHGHCLWCVQMCFCLNLSGLCACVCVTRRQAGHILNTWPLMIQHMATYMTFWHFGVVMCTFLL